MESITPLASLSLTHVHYDPTDTLSYLCAWLALVPQTLCVIYVTLIWSSREVEILLMFIGQIGCETLNFILKRIIKEERPKQMNGKGYGMPSSHAQFVTFFSLSLSLFLLLRHNPPNPNPNPATPLTTNNNTTTTPKSKPKPTFLSNPYTDPKTYQRPLNPPERLLLSLLSTLLATLVSLSRIYLAYHTPTQVAVGSAAGALSALGWFLVTGWLRREGWVESWVGSWIGRVGRWRDLVLEEDLAEAGWRRWCDRVEGNGGEEENKKKKKGR